jgi:hypothetical protein
MSDWRRQYEMRVCKLKKRLRAPCQGIYSKVSKVGGSKRGYLGSCGGCSSKSKVKGKQMIVMKR